MTSHPASSMLPKISRHRFRLKTPLLNWIKGLTRHMSIGTKIGLGYGVALGVAVLGTGSGIIIGEHYHEQAIEQEEDAREEMYLLSRLETNLLQVEIHEQMLIDLVNQPNLWRKEYRQFVQHITEVRQGWAEFIESEGYTKNPPVEELAEEVKKSKFIIKTYQVSLENYLKESESIVKQFENYDRTPKALKLIQNRILKLKHSPLFFQLDSLADEIAELSEFAHQEYEEAEAKGLMAEKLRLAIIIASILLSAIVASLLALYTSQVITQPLKELTAVAQRVARETNFDLQVPVTTDDEVGVLATTLNTLMQRVSTHTQELYQKNQQLLQTQDNLKETLHNLRQTQSQLVQTEKMSSLGQMVAGVAHEINNPVNFISNNIDYANSYTKELIELISLYQQQYPNPTSVIQDKTEAIDLDFLIQDLPQTVKSMKMGTERISKLVVSLRNFSRMDTVEMKSVDINEGLDSTILILNHQLKHGIKVIKNYGDLPLVDCYPAQLNQVFMNIMQNAIDALNSEGNHPDKQIEIATERLGENQIQVRIRDNGCGILTTVKNKIFDPFFTTKDVGKGTGLGLSICYQIITQHQGQINANSLPGQGTEFAIALPIKQPKASVVNISDQLPVTA